MSETQTDLIASAPVVEPTEKPSKQEKTKPSIRDTEDYTIELRRENEKLRKTLEEQANKRAEELSNQKLETLRAETEEKATAKAEKLVEKRLSEIEEASKARLVKSELRAYAMKASCVDFEDLYDIMKRSELKKVEFDADGEVKNAGAIVAEMKQNKPHLFAGVNTASTERAPVTRTSPTETEKPALTMNKADYEKAKRALGRM